jgi:hypothetical protein
LWCPCCHVYLRRRITYSIHSEEVTYRKCFSSAILRPRSKETSCHIPFPLRRGHKLSPHTTPCGPCTRGRKRLFSPSLRSELLMKPLPTSGFTPEGSSDSLLIWVIETGLRKRARVIPNCIIVSARGGTHQDYTPSEPCRLFPAADVRAWSLETIWPTYPRLSASYKGERLRNNISISADHPVLQEAAVEGLRLDPMSRVWRVVDVWILTLLSLRLFIHCQDCERWGGDDLTLCRSREKGTGGPEAKENQKGPPPKATSVRGWKR